MDANTRLVEGEERGDRLLRCDGSVWAWCEGGVWVCCEGLRVVGGVVVGASESMR